jgi:hypothetical protein
MQHKELANGRWNSLSLVEQLGNIGSEVSRASRAKTLNNIDRMTPAIERCLELIDLSIQDPKNRKRLRELCRIREVLCDFYYGENNYASTASNLDSYFLPFGMVANRK